jgi:TRAP-type C4-dicarboxylate transport system substrate-binding protein
MGSRLKYRLGTTGVALVLVAGAAGVAAPAEASPSLAAASGKTYTIKFTSTQAATSPNGELQYKFAQEVSKASHGRITVHVYPNSILGSEDELVPQVVSGATQMTELFAPQMAAYVSTFNFFQIPMIFNTQAQVQKGLASQAMATLDGQFLKKTGVRVLGWGSLGFVQLLNSQHPVTTPAEVSGLKVRIAPGSVPLQKSLALLKADPVPLAESDDYTGEQSGLINAIVNPSYTFLSTKDYENLKYLTNINFQYNPNVILINNKFFDSLPKNLQSIVQQTAGATTKQEIAAVNKASASANKQLEALGVKIETLTSGQRQAFFAVIQPYLKTTVSTYGAGLFKAFGVNTKKL